MNQNAKRTQRFGRKFRNAPAGRLFQQNSQQSCHIAASYDARANSIGLCLSSSTKMLRVFALARFNDRPTMRGPIFWVGSRNKVVVARRPVLSARRMHGPNPQNA